LKRQSAGRVLIVLEPRSNTMRLGVHREELARSLRQADAVWLFQPEDLDWDLCDVSTGMIVPVKISNQLDEMVESIVAEARSGDRLVVMSNGGFGGIHEKLLTALDAAHA
jgi:UDP-N-acetylmuramate: L-alanyl-gamma-D-glutamyl-meso-diaminopimelate ligase